MYGINFIMRSSHLQSNPLYDEMISYTTLLPHLRIVKMLMTNESKEFDILN